MFGADGKVIGLVSAGITIKSVSGVADNQFPLLFGSAAGILLLTMGVRRSSPGGCDARPTASARPR